jgi:hypothetical protein
VPIRWVGKNRAFEQVGFGFAGGVGARGDAGTGQRQSEQVTFDGDDRSGLEQAWHGLAEAHQVLAAATKGRDDGFKTHRLVAGTPHEVE